MKITHQILLTFIYLSLKYCECEVDLCSPSNYGIKEFATPKFISMGDTFVINCSISALNPNQTTSYEINLIKDKERFYMYSKTFCKRKLLTKSNEIFNL